MTALTTSSIAVMNMVVKLEVNQLEVKNMIDLLTKPRSLTRRILVGKPPIDMPMPRLLTTEEPGMIKSRLGCCRATTTRAASVS